MKIFKVASGSDGNAYILKSESTGRMVILDCGVALKKIVAHKEFTRFADIDFIYCSHEHQDHCKYAYEFENNGLNVIFGNKIPSGINHCNEWVFFVETVTHNVPNFAIVIRSTQDKETMCYATDFSAMPMFYNVDKWLYEINYDEDIAQYSLCNDDGRDVSYLYSIIENHNSLQKAQHYFQVLNEEGFRPKEIKFCHLSKNNIQKNRVKKIMNKYCDNIEIF